MGSNKPALYAAGVTSLGFLSFALAAAAVGLPVWAHFDNGEPYSKDRGYFGPWRMCKTLHYGRELCGVEVSTSKFRPSGAVYVSGLFGVGASITLGLFCILSVLQIAMISSKDKVVFKYKPLVMIKFILALLSAIFSLFCAGLFAVQTDDDRSGFRVSRGASFYMEIIVVALTIGLIVLALYDMLFSRKPGGDPTIPVDLTSAPATTYNNPGFREGAGPSGRSGNGISMTDSSGKPYVGSFNGSLNSMATVTTNVTGSSSLGSVRSPLRSSLKKPRPREGLGIQNPGFSGSGHSPTMQRNGSVKKVRIQTTSTDV